MDHLTLTYSIIYQKRKLENKCSKHQISEFYDKDVFQKNCFDKQNDDQFNNFIKQKNGNTRFLKSSLNLSCKIIKSIKFMMFIFPFYALNFINLSIQFIQIHMKYNLIFLTLLTVCVIITQQSIVKQIHKLTPRYNSTAYAAQLAKRQAEFDSMMQDIQNQVNQLDQNILKLQGNNTYQIMKLQQGLADERDSLYDVENALNKPFALKPCEKPNLTQQQKNQLNNQIKLTNQSLLDMKAQVKKCTEQSIDKCTVKDELIHEITRAELYLSVIDDYVNGNCNRVQKSIAPQEATGLVDLNDRLFKDNLKAPNWIYGNITEEQYRLMVFAETTKFNMTTCPIETPFANKVNNTCFSCPEDSIFSLGQRVCTCKQGYKFDQETNLCVSLTPIKPCNQTGSCVSMCPNDKPRWNSVNKLCETCPLDKPVVNRQTSSCQSCPEMTPLWNQLTYKCEPCPKNTHYVQNLSKCVPCKDDEKYDQGVKKCIPICKSYQIYNKQQGKCYTLEELNGCKCNQRYNTTLKECEDVCDHGLQWLPSDKKCGPPALPQFKDKCKYHERLNKQTNQCQHYCDSTVAWYDRENHVCIRIGCSVECKCKEIFDNLTGKCIPQSHQCPIQQFYNTTSSECQIFCTNGQFYNSISRACEAIQIPPPPPVIPTCAFDEFYDQVAQNCIKRCSDILQIFNKNSQTCDCIDGYHLDEATGKCLINPIKCGSNQRYSKSQAQCVCIDGYIKDSSNNCSPMCDSGQNKIYDSVNKRCMCLNGYILGADQISCVSLASTCLSSNNVHYDALTNSCVCDAGFTLNLNDGRCYIEVKRCNEALHFVLNLQTNQCQCASGYRLSQDGATCLSLTEICLRNPNTFFNTIALSCECLPGFKASNQNGDILTCQAMCKMDQTYNELTKQCVNRCPSDYYYDMITQSCAYRCQADYVYNNVTLQCERIIKSCPDPVNQFYDNKTGQCHSCPAGYLLNQITLSCEKKVVSCAAGQFYDDSTGLCKYCKTGQTYNNITRLCQYLNTTCSGGMFFDFNIGQCKYCPGGYIYDESLLDCRSNCTVDQMFDYGKNLCILISSTCNEYQYYDAVQRKCILKPICSSIQRYEQASRKCVDIALITSVNAANLVHSNFKTYQTYYQSRKTADQYLRDCPDTTPFYSSSIKSCVMCPPTHPYYNLETEKCQDCGNDKYDSTLRKCIGLAQPAATGDGETADLTQLNYSLDRLVMNIV